MNPIRVGVNGAKGRMGLISIAAVEKSEDMKLVFGLDAGDDLGEGIKRCKPHVVVDFTIPSAVFSNTMAIIEHGVRPVIGTTGLTKEELDVVRRALAEKKLGGIVAPNFSLGALLMMKMASVAAGHFDSCEIIEQHHARKVDAPSGTARLTAGIISKGRPKRKTSGESAASRGGLHDGIRVHSIRLPGRMAHQEVIFGGPGETLTIRHDSISRESFVPGIVQAIRRVLEIEGLEVGLKV